MAKKLEETIEDLPKLKECFIITPIGEVNSEIFNKANGLINAVITPVLKDFGFEAVAAHQISSSGSINNQLIKKILESELVIANLTGLNPNVMYELAIRHSARLPVVIMSEKAITPRLPFDISDQRTIFYDDSLAGSELAKPMLSNFIEAALADKKPDNPIYAAANQESIFKELDKGDPLLAIMNKIDKLSNRVSNLQSFPINKHQKLYHFANVAFHFINEEGKIKDGRLDGSYSRILEEIQLLGELNDVKVKSFVQDNETVTIELQYEKTESYQSLLKDLHGMKQIGIIGYGN